jgi:hypothetical protein
MSSSTIQGCRALAATVRPINEIRVDTMSADYLYVIRGQTAPSRFGSTSPARYDRG